MELVVVAAVELSYHVSRCDGDDAVGKRVAGFICVR